MTKRYVNTFSGGIDRDTSVNKYSNTHYYDAENVRPISNNTFSNGAITNVDGLLDKIDFSSVTYANLESGALISNITIFKTTSIRNTVAFFGKCDFTTSSGTIYYDNHIIMTSELSNDDFSNITIVKLYYNAPDGTVDFSYEMSVIPKHESSSIQKVYWADGINPLRMLNVRDFYTDDVAAPESYSTSSSLDHIPNVEFTNVEIVDILSGGIYTSGVVQYAYQLYNKN